MTHAKVKSDRIDARMLAKLHAADAARHQVCDQTTVLPRRLARRSQLVRCRTRQADFRS